MRSSKWSAHISVGCALLDGDDRIAMHHHHDSPFGELYTLMRETLHDNETLEAGVARGLMEEWGAQGTIVAFLGAKLAHLEDVDGSVMDKTTLYFFARLTTQDDTRRDPTDPESSSAIEWLTLDEATKELNIQAVRFPGRPDLHEAGVIELVQRYLNLSST